MERFFVTLKEFTSSFEASDPRGSREGWGAGGLSSSLFVVRGRGLVYRLLFGGVGVRVLFLVCLGGGDWQEGLWSFGWNWACC